MIQKYIIRLLNLINIACTKPFGFKSSPCHWNDNKKDSLGLYKWYLIDALREIS
jgi:hypothetical protein